MSANADLVNVSIIKQAKKRAVHDKMAIEIRQKTTSIMSVLNRKAN